MDIHDDDDDDNDDMDAMLNPIIHGDNSNVYDVIIPRVVVVSVVIRLTPTLPSSPLGNDNVTKVSDGKINNGNDDDDDGCFAILSTTAPSTGHKRVV